MQHKHAMYSDTAI